MKFGIDIDGTVTTNDWLYPFIKRDFDIDIDPELVTEYDLSDFVTVPPHEFNQWWTKKEAELIESPPLSPNAKEILNDWAVDHELYFISARSQSVLQVTRDWFLRNQITQHHIELLGSHNKIETAKLLQVDLFFEDKHDNAVDISEQCNIPVLLFDAPYNRKPIPDKVIRVTSWLEAKNWVDRWIKNQA